MKDTINQIKNSIESITNRLEYPEDRTSALKTKYLILKTKFSREDGKKSWMEPPRIMGYREKTKFKNYWNSGRHRDTNQRKEQTVQWNNIRKFPKPEK